MRVVPRRTFAQVIAASMVIASLVAGSSPANAETKSYLVNTTDIAAAAAAVGAAGGTVTTTFAEISALVAESSDPGFLAAITASPFVRSAAEDVEVDWLGPVSQEPADEDVGASGVNAEPRFGLQWNIRHIRADVTAAVGDRGCGVKRARVAVIDTGVYSRHEDLAPNLNMALSRSFVPTEPTAEFVPFFSGQFSHATHVAGIVAAPINDKGVQGVAPCAEIVPIKVLRSRTGSGSFASVIAGILYAASVGADVADMSLGATFDRKLVGGLGPLIAALSSAVDHATASGTLVVSSAGNDALDLNSRIWTIPAQSGNGMGVSALAPAGFFSPFGSTNADLLASYSNFGQSVVNVGAPGGDLRYTGTELCTVAGLTRQCRIFDLVLSPGAVRVLASGALQHVYCFAAGTSMAAPHVSGLAALYVGKFGKTRPAIVQAALQNSAVDILKPGADPESGHGRIDAPSTLGY